MASGKKPRTTRITIIYIAATLAALIVVFALVQYMRSQVAEVYELTVSGLDAETPAQAQAMCRADNAKFVELSEKYPDCLWAWCGDDKLYIVRGDSLVVKSIGADGSFDEVSFTGEKGEKHTGYLIDPLKPPALLAQIELGEADEYNYDNVSMSIREGMRSGAVNYEDAVYLWESGGSMVYVVRSDSLEFADGTIAAFTDDGGKTRVCYILDTVIG